jgi:hypothetical protein
MRGWLGFCFRMLHALESGVKAFFERPIEPLKHLHPICLFFLHIIQLLFHIARVTYFQNIRECLHKLVRNNRTQICRIETVP